jgi:hypothetical protein
MRPKLLLIHGAITGSFFLPDSLVVSILVALLVG